MQVLGEASVDIDFACHGAPERLLDCLFGRCRRLVGRGCAGRAQKCALPAPSSEFSGGVAGRAQSALRPKRGHCTLIGVFGFMSLSACCVTHMCVQERTWAIDREISARSALVGIPLREFNV